ncbi:ABC transporter permease [Elongatibacter sediminis]|uniref:ABC transporter permease n=1 Tax=Elongatibacter sediminis TaxID=3119006 RepID=A0AAW9RB93_9GAMM
MNGLRRWMTRLRVMTQKELLQLLRDTVLIFFTVYAFTVDVFLAGSGVSLSLNRAALVVYDGDHSQASREFASRFHEPYFNRVGTLDKPADTIDYLERGEAMVALDIPEGFEASLYRGQPTSVQMQIDTTNTVLGLLASSYGQQIAGQFSLDVAKTQQGLAPDGDVAGPFVLDEHRVWFNPNQKDSWFMSVSELLTVITLFAMMLPAAAMVREKERGTIEQLLVSPLSAFQVMFPKILAMTLVILILTALSLGLVLKGIFNVPFKGSLVTFFAVTTLYVFTTSGLGLLVATVARNMAQAGMLIILIIAPMLFLSGAWTPPEAMPDFMRHLMAISPLHYFIDASYGILLKGSGLLTIAPQLAGMAVLGTLIFMFGLWGFGRQFG